MRRFWLILVAACGSSSSSPPAPSAPETPAKPATKPDVVATPATPVVPDVPKVTLDLGDAWTPTLFAPDESGKVPDYRANYLAQAREEDMKGNKLSGLDALQELYGIVPSLAVVRARLNDDKRHACHAAIDSTPIGLIDRVLDGDNQQIVQRGDDERQELFAQLESKRKKEKLDDIAALADLPATKEKYKRWKTLDDRHRGIIAVQKHLACEGWLSEKAANGKFTWETGEAVEMFQRRNFVMPTERLDEDTRAAMMLSSKELDYRMALRVLRERVAEADGLIEDGTAGDGPKQILGRDLDPPAMRAVRGHDKPLENAAPDLISPATEAAAKALGWTDPDKTRDWLNAHKDEKVAVALPPVPSYHAKHMDLDAEIDRGDVYYDEKPNHRTVAHRPTLVLYVTDKGVRRPLLRWPTTIGGWEDQNSDTKTDSDAAASTSGSGSGSGSDAPRQIVQMWKESDVGPRVWRDIFAAPTWRAPESTPDRELLVNLYNGKYALKKAVFGPGPHAAYGMVLIEHYQILTKKDGTEVVDDNGIGTHGSSSVTSIVNGSSHGCHRLYNQLAVRLGDYLLHHRDHKSVGQTPEGYSRTVKWQPALPKDAPPDAVPPDPVSFTMNLKTRGYLYQLTPPVVVNVLRGNIMTARKTPPPPYIPPPPPKKDDEKTAGL